MQSWSEHPLLAPLVERLQEHPRLLRSPVDHRDRARLDDARQVEELIVLAEGLLARTFGRALQNRDAVADALDDLCAPSGELLGRKDVRSGEDGLRRRPGASRERDEKGRDDA